MAGSPNWKVYDEAGNYIAATKDPIHAVMLASCLMDGVTVRYGHARRDIVWTEGAEAPDAVNSYDRAAEIISERRARIFARMRAR